MANCYKIIFDAVKLINGESGKQNNFTTIFKPEVTAKVDGKEVVKNKRISTIFSYNSSNGRVKIQLYWEELPWLQNYQELGLPGMVEGEELNLTKIGPSMIKLCYKKAEITIAY